MSLIKIDAVRHKRTSNIGEWLSAKVYSDVKGNKCECGGFFTSVSVIKRRLGDVTYPICDKCQFPPSKLRIKAKVINEHFKAQYIDLRHHEGQRLEEINDVLGVLNQIDREIELGTFDVKKYKSKKQRDSFLFKNFIHSTMEKDGVEGYLEYSRKREEREEITYYGMKGKVKYCRVLEKFFGETDIAAIDEAKIDEFKSSFTEKFSNRDEGLKELRVILKFAYKRKKIHRVPSFELIPTSESREITLDINDARSYIPSVREPQYRLIFFLHTVYAFRPCETRAIKMKDCDILNEKLKITSHFSGTRQTEGRKSKKTGKMSTLEFDMVKELKNWIQDECKWLGPDDYIFQRIPQKFRHDKEARFIPKPSGEPLGEKTLPKAWARTLKEIGAPHVAMYEMRGARGTEIIELSNGNILEGSKFLGHTNTKTTEKHYLDKKNTSAKFIDKEATILPLAR